VNHLFPRTTDLVIVWLPVACSLSTSLTSFTSFFLPSQQTTGKYTLKGTPTALALPRSVLNPNRMIIPNSDHELKLHVQQGTDKIMAFTLQAVSQHQVKLESSCL
jgi:hypothetical protein